MYSTGLMMLYDEGKFQLDDPISKYLPGLAQPHGAGQLQSERLDLHHRTGQERNHHPAAAKPHVGHQLPGHWHEGGDGYLCQSGYSERHWDATGSLATSMDALGKLPLMHQPGERLTYGLSVDVVGRLMEVLSGQPLDQYMRRRLFDPLGMQDTWFYLPADKQARLSGCTRKTKTRRPYYMQRQGSMIPDYPKAKGTYFSGGAGLSSTIDDYAVFLQMMLNKGTYNGRRLLKPETVALMTQNQIGTVNQGNHKFGLGFSITPPEAATVPGLSPGSFEWGGIFGTTYWVDPQQKLVALLYTQKYPNSTGRDLAGKFKAAVYQSFVPDQKAQATTGTKE